ncbi:MAG: hypothetical protein AAFP90_00100, partial [Planctomycetota bacterium]
NTGSITPEMLVGDMLVAEPLTQPPSKHAPETIAPKQARPAKQPQPDAAGKAMDITFPSSAASSPVKVARVAGTMPPANVLPEGAIVTSMGPEMSGGAAVMHAPPTDVPVVMQNNAMPITSALAGNTVAPPLQVGAPAVHNYHQYPVSAGCGEGCPPGWHFRGDVLYMNRDQDSRFSLIQNTGLDNFDYELSGRGTLTRRFDCVDGVQISWFGPIRWNEQQTVNAPPGGNILTRLVPALPVPDTALSTFGVPRSQVGAPAFPNVVQQSQSYTSRFYGFEANRVYGGWDVVQLVYGLRYLDFNEAIAYDTVNDINQRGAMRVRSDNRMYGAQIGMDAGTPISQYGWVDTKLRAGIYLNDADSKVDLANNGAVILDTGGSDTEIAGFFEFGLGLRQDLGEALSIHAGYEAWYLTNVATAADQIFTTVTPTMGTGTRINDDVFFYGLTMGATLRW